jgi:2-C-methyl-D-erythritol 4-phosphate cytidylyltransferase
VRAIDGEPGNFKITTAEDLARAEAAVSEFVRG